MSTCVGWLILCNTHTHTHTHTHPFNGPLSRTTQVSRYQKGKTNLDFTEARDSEWQWHQLGHMQVCTSLQTNNHASTPPVSFYRPYALPAAQPTVSKHWRHEHWRHDPRWSGWSSVIGAKICHTGNYSQSFTNVAFSLIQSIMDTA